MRYKWGHPVATLPSDKGDHTSLEVGHKFCNSVAAVSLAANCSVDEEGQLWSCGHGAVGLDAARKDLVGQLGDVELADRDKSLKIGAKVDPAEVGREVLGPFVAQGGAACVCGDDVVDVAQHN
eukprot:6179568-Pleurochrysis_carterae.AAC.6